MKKLQITIGLGISLLIIPLMVIMFTPTVNADTYSDTFNPNEEYVYNVTKWDQELYWFFGITFKALVGSNTGGEIRVKFTGFYDYNPNTGDPDYEPGTDFENPIPFINISFYKKIGDIQVLNNTLVNVSCAEAAYAMAIGYNQFNPGFLIPTDNFTRLENRVATQNESIYELSFYSVEKFQKMIRITFKQKSAFQNTTLIYDKSTGILAWVKVENDFGPDIEFKLNGYVLDFTTTSDNIPAFPILIVFKITGFTLIVSIFIKRKKCTTN